jgi:2-succinyl-6-hydroxy-2,4-cyclohexadiene-1-carboxylate synthase
MKIDLNGINYHVEKMGNGFPLLLLHGFTGSSSTWHPFTSFLAKSSSMVMVDLIGHGQTDSPADLRRYNILEVAKDLKVLLDKLEIEKTDLLGYSMGGRLAIAFAATYPDRVRKLVLESTTPGLKTEMERKARRKQDESLAAKIITEGLIPFVDYWEKIPLFQTQVRLSTETKGVIRKQRLQNNPLGLANSLIGMGAGAQPSWWKAIREFYFETLILTGALDEKFCRIGEELVKGMPKAKLSQIIGAGHAIHVEDPEKFGTIVGGFLSR